MQTPLLYELEQSFKDYLTSIHHPINSSIEFDTNDWKRFDCPTSSQGNKNVSYKAHSDGRPCLKIQCHKCHSDIITFKYNGKIHLDSSKLFEMQSKVKKQKLANIKRRQSALVIMKNEWEKSLPCLNHPYFDRKNITISKQDGLRIDKTNNILCPIKLIDNSLISTQKIPVFGKKKFHFDTSPKSGFHYLGAQESFEKFILSESIGTGLTIKEALNSTIVCTYGKSNFIAVAIALKSKYPASIFLFICDLDIDRGSEMYATEAIRICGGRYVLPNFSSIPPDLQPGISRSDFNDLFCLLLAEGKNKDAALAEVRRQIDTYQCDSVSGRDDMTNERAKKDNFESTVEFIYQTIKKEDYPDWTLDKNGKKRPKNTYGNLQYMLNRLKIVVRWNDMTRTREVLIPNFPIFYDDEENSALREITNLAIIHNMPHTMLDQHLDSLAQKKRYHPIVECIKQNPWDNEPRLDQFIRTIKAANPELAYKLIRRWMISAIAAAFSEQGVALQGALVIQGKQNSGKTTWVKALDPDNCGAIKEGAILDPSNKDSVLTLARYWIVELGEVDATFRKSDIARLKAFITNQLDEMRMPYARKNSRFKRRTAFIATVNESRYLTDETGNRRWWTVEAVSINNNHGLNMRQVWAEVYELWKGGEKTWLTDEELIMLNEENSQHEQIDPFEEKVLEHFDWCKNWQQNNTLCMQASDVLREIGYDKPNRAQATRMGSILIKLTGKAPKRRKHILPRMRPMRNYTE